MKSIIVLIVSVILVIFFGTWQLKYLEETSNYFLGDASQVQNILENKNKGEKDREIAVNDLNKTWQIIKKPWSVHINHEEIDSINQRVISYSVYVLENNKEEATNEYENLIDNIEHILHSQKLLPENIF